MSTPKTDRTRARSKAIWSAYEAWISATWWYSYSSAVLSMATAIAKNLSEPNQLNSKLYRYIDSECDLIIESNISSTAWQNCKIYWNNELVYCEDELQSPQRIVCDISDYSWFFELNDIYLYTLKEDGNK